MFNKIAFQSTQTTREQHRFCSCDLDLDPMTLVYESNLDILNDILYGYQK